MNQSYLKTFARYTLLSILGMLGVSCYILADTFFISKAMGTRGLASLNLAIPVYNFIHGTGLMLGMGGATKFSISKTSHDSKRMNVIFSNTVYLALTFGVLFACIGIFASTELTRILGADAAIFSLTDTYLKWMLSFSPAFIMNDVLLCFVRNDDNPLLVTVAMLMGSFSNILLDYVFIFSFDMGMLGAVLATGCSPVVSMLIMSRHWQKKRSHFHLVRAKVQWQLMRQNFSLGFPSLIGEVASAVVLIVFNLRIMRLEGNVGVAAYGVIANISLVMLGIYTGIAQGVQPLMSEAYGRGDEKKIRKALQYAMVTSVVVATITYLMIYGFAEPITMIFNSENNQQLLIIAMQGLKLYFIGKWFVGINMNLSVYFTSTERATPAHVLSLLRGIVLIVPMAFLLSALWDMTGIWLAYPVTEVIVSLLGLGLYKKHPDRNKN